MSYNHPIPDAPIALSMLPREESPAASDLIYLVKPNNPIGQRSKAVKAGNLMPHSTGWVSVDDIALTVVGTESTLGSVTIPKGWGGRFSIKFKITTAYGAATGQAGIVQNFKFQAVDTDFATDENTEWHQRVVCNSSSTVEDDGTGQGVYTNWSASVDIPLSTRTDDYSERTIAFKMAPRDNLGVPWNLTEIEIKADVYPIFGDFTFDE